MRVKYKQLLGDENTYIKLENDPTGSYKRKLIRSLQTLKKEGKISESQYKYLYPTQESIPRLYCTPKIHKQGLPLRPIVDYTGSILYNLSKSLADILQPLVGLTEHHVKDIQDLVESLKDTVIQDDEVFISHDVVSLFTKTPINEALIVIKQRLDKDTTLCERTNLTSKDIIDLLEMVLMSTYFIFRGTIYKQTFGAAMGSPVSPIVANLYMEHLEQRALDTAPTEYKPRLWKRYVDDILEIVNKDSVSLLTDHLNQVDPTDNIKFTFELEKDGSIPFLDTRISRKPEGSLKFTVYRKPTHTNQYLNFESHHPLHQKLGVVHTLFNRCDTVVSDPKDREDETTTISTALSQCGYPRWTFKRKNKTKHYTINEG